MERTYIKDIKVGETNKVKGFIENIRDKKTMAFIVVRDITGKLQVTIEKEKFPEIAKEIGISQTMVSREISKIRNIAQKYI